MGTWRSKTAGILTIIGGIVGIVFGAIASAGLGLASMLTGFEFMAGIGAGLVALGIIALIGGIFTLRRRSWGFALAGAICSLFPIVPLGIVAIIFVSIGKKEFD